MIWVDDCLKKIKDNYVDYGSYFVIRFIHQIRRHYGTVSRLALTQIETRKY